MPFTAYYVEPKDPPKTFKGLKQEAIFTFVQMIVGEAFRDFDRRDWVTFSMMYGHKFMIWPDERDNGLRLTIVQTEF